MRFGIATMSLLLACVPAQAQSCASAYAAPSYGRTYSYRSAAVLYGAPTYQQSYSYAPAKVYKEPATYVEDYVRVRYVLALPVIELGAVAAAYAPQPQQAPVPPPFSQAAPPPALKSAGNESQMQQLIASQTQILQALEKLSGDVRRIDERVQRLERTRPPLAQPKERQQPYEQGPPPPKEDDVDKAFAAANAATCAACHSRSNAAKYGGDFVFSEDNGRIAPLTAEQRDDVVREIKGGKMPKLKSKRAEEAGVKPMSQQIADALYAAIDKQILNGGKKRKESAE